MMTPQEAADIISMQHAEVSVPSWGYHAYLLQGLALQGQSYS